MNRKLKMNLTSRTACMLLRSGLLLALCAPALNSCAAPRSSFDLGNLISAQQEEAPLDYYDWVSSVPPREQLAEKIRLRARFETSGEMTDGIQLALVTGLIEPVAREELLYNVEMLNAILQHHYQQQAQHQEQTDVDQQPRTASSSTLQADGAGPTPPAVQEPPFGPLPELTGSITQAYAQFAQLWRTALLQRVTVMTISNEHSEQRVELEKLNRQLLESNLRLQEENELLRKENPLLRQENENLLLQIEALKAIEQQMNQREQQQEFP